MTDPVRDPRDLLPPDEPIHLLDQDGTFHPREDWPIDLDDQSLRELYRHMVVTRRIDREAINLQRQGQLGLFASCLGQEAAQIGSATALGPNDWVFPSYRELGAGIVRGLDPLSIMHLFRGTWLSDHDPYESNFAFAAIPIGTQVLHATGFAIGALLDDNPIVVLTYFGDGATSEGDPHEGMNFAAVFGAPCVFFIQNNQWAISVPIEKQTNAPSLAHKAIGYGMPGHRVDGNDVLASYAVTRRAVDDARRGHGPSLIEAVTYRMGAHTTSDDPSRYRTQEELEYAATLDPIVRYQRFLEKTGRWDDTFEKEVREEAETRAAEIREAIWDAPHGDPLEVFEHVYVDATGHFERQRSQLAAELRARREDDT